MRESVCHRQNVGVVGEDPLDTRAARCSEPCEKCAHIEAQIQGLVTIDAEGKDSHRVTCQESGPKGGEETALQTESKTKITVAKVLEEPLEFAPRRRAQIGICPETVEMFFVPTGANVWAEGDWDNDAVCALLQAYTDKVVQLTLAQVVAEFVAELDDRIEDLARIGIFQEDLASFRDWLTQEVNNG